MEEIWEWIKGYEGHYQINSEGKVRSFKNNVGKGLTSHFDKRGYLTICLSKGGKKKIFKLHRLIAETFLPNPESKKEVHHVDGNKLNNSLDNLMWCNPEEHRRVTRENAIVKAGLEIPKELDLVFIESNQALTTSLKIAKTFEKEHKDVLEKIKFLAAEISHPNSAEIPAQWWREWFNPVFVEQTYVDDSGKTNPMYLMNRDGFVELVGNFSGKKAREWKRKYHAEFNRMEKIISERNFQPKQKKSKDADYIPRKVKLLRELVDVTENPDLQDKLIEKILTYV